MKNLDNYLDTNISNFEGDYDLYTGEGDDFLDFAGGHNFANESDTNRVFVVNIDATQMNVNKKIAVLRGYNDGDSTPKLTDGVVLSGKDGDVSYKMTASGSPDKILSFQEFVKAVPTNLVGIRISATKPEQLQQVLQFIEKSPFSTPKSKDIFLGTLISENTERNDIITVPTPGVILGPETKMLFDIVAGGKLSIAFFSGAVLSTSSALRNKRKKAIAHISTAGVQNVRKMSQLGVLSKLSNKGLLKG